ncbi:MAG: FG-GAP repeat domain-containing protein [Planctomycetota bacterium]
MAPISPIGTPPAFTEFPGLDLTGVNGYGRSLAWGDCDNDLDLDLAVAGWTGAVVTTKVYENDGSGCLAEFEGLNLTDAGSVSLAWGDCDNDGDIDVAIAGSTGSAFITTVHENDSARDFAAFPDLDLVGVKYGSLAWGDCDNDGDLDLAVAGWFRTGSHTTIYENNGAGGFAEFPDLGLPNAFGGGGSGNSQA